MFYNWICWQAECANTGTGADIDMISFLLRMKLWKILRSKNMFSFIIQLNERKGRKEAESVICNFNKRPI